jgi:hypothetical protein
MLPPRDVFTDIIGRNLRPFWTSARLVIDGLTPDEHNPLGDTISLHCNFTSFARLDQPPGTKPLDKRQDKGAPWIA